MFIEMYSEAQIQCSGKTKFGERCKKMATSKYCFQHQKLIVKKKLPNSKFKKNLTKTATTTATTTTTSPVLRQYSLPNYTMPYTMSSPTLSLPQPQPQPQTISTFSPFEIQPSLLLHSVSIGSVD
eukprot:Pgem_evm1s19811